MLINDRNLRLQHIMLINGGGELQLWYETSPSRRHYHLTEQCLVVGKRMVILIRGGEYQLR
jgi:hypothetical protein